MRLTVQLMKGVSDLFALRFFKIRDQIFPIIVRRWITMQCAGAIELFGSVRYTGIAAFDRKISRLGILVDLEFLRWQKPRETSPMLSRTGRQPSPPIPAALRLKLCLPRSMVCP